MNLKSIFSALFLISSISLSAQLHDSFIEFLKEGKTVITEEFNAVGISIAVSSGNDFWAGAGGMNTAQDSLTTEDVLAIGSITKPIVSACILGLMEEGALALNDPIHMYLDNYEFIDSTISIKQLLYHTSGIYNYTDNPVFIDIIFNNPDYLYSPEEILEEFLLAPSFDKGELQEYSNTNYLLLGMIIEEISGRPYYDEIIDRFNLEQDYPSLTVAPQIQDTDNMAHLWADLGFGQTDVQAFGLSLDALFSSAGSAGAFVATPTDLAHFGRDLLTGQLLSEASMDSFYNYHPLQLFGVIDYGLGVWQSETPCGVSFVGHNGGIIYTAELAYVEEYDLTVVVMTNDGDGIAELNGVSGIAQTIICEYESTLSNTNELVEEDYSIKVYPNPFDQYISLEFQNDSHGDIHLQVFNELGQVVQSKNYYDQQSINENLLEGTDLSSGIYYLRFTIGDQIENIKVIKL